MLHCLPKSPYFLFNSEATEKSQISWEALWQQDGNSVKITGNIQFKFIFIVPVASSLLIWLIRGNLPAAGHLSKGAKEEVIGKRKYIKRREVDIIHVNTMINQVAG